MTARRVPAPDIGSPRTAAWRSRWAGRAFFACAAAALGPLFQLGACQRRADIIDEPDGAAPLVPPPEIDAGDIPELDSGLGTDAYPTCGDRPEGACRGPVDFVCDFDVWVRDTAARCQEETSCKTNGWLEVKMEADGCVVEIGMDQPNDAIVACLLAEFGSKRCPCMERQSTHFFGLVNTGVCSPDEPEG